MRRERSSSTVSATSQLRTGIDESLTHLASGFAKDVPPILKDTGHQRRVHVGYVRSASRPPAPAQASDLQHTHGHIPQKRWYRRGAGHRQRRSCP